MTTAFLALMWGSISAFSLPLGAVVGLWAKPLRRMTSALMAFGGGALLFALTIELFAHSLHISHQGDDVWIILATMMGAALGGILFEFLNQILSDRGGYLRKVSLLNRRIHLLKRRHAQEMIAALSQVKLLTVLPPDEFVHVIPSLKRERHSSGSVIFRQGDLGRKLYFIVSGKVQVIRESESIPHLLAELGSGDVVGEIALLSDEPRFATAKAVTDIEVYSLHRSDFEVLLKRFPELQESIRKILQARIKYMETRHDISTEDARLWREKALMNLKHLSIPVMEEDRLHHSTEQKGDTAALSIWLGIALDGIPESLVIGMLTVDAVSSGASISLAFIAGVFLANFPEAMSSAVSMNRQGIGKLKIIWMWISLCIMTGLGALIGALIFPGDPQGTMAYLIAGIEGIAAGAMLTMIADTMLPEAFEQGGGAIAGLSTLAGFLAALSVKVFGLH
ncbi:MAG: cyclic nucleotide-binding domain-containing protein [Thermodesulfobacteriota bacterium]